MMAHKLRCCISDCQHSDWSTALLHRCFLISENSERIKFSKITGNRQSASISQKLLDWSACSCFALGARFATCQDIFMSKGLPKTTLSSEGQNFTEITSSDFCVQVKKVVTYRARFRRPPVSLSPHADQTGREETPEIHSMRISVKQNVITPKKNTKTTRKGMSDAQHFGGLQRLLSELNF